MRASLVGAFDECVDVLALLSKLRIVINYATILSRLGIQNSLFLLKNKQSVTFTVALESVPMSDKIESNRLDCYLL